MRFSDFLQEQKEKHAVMAFGRMNPITVGHEKLVNTVQDIAKKVGGSAHIVVSHSQDAKKNPLNAAQKLKHAKRAFPGVNVSASDKESPNFLSQAAKLHKQGVTHFHMVGGSDRADEYHKLLHKYNNVKGPHGHFNFKHIEVHSAGDRDPDAEGVEGMSASKMREHATKGNYKEFRKGVPSKMSDAHAKDMYNDVRKGMNVHEDVDLQFETLLIEGVHDKAIFKAVFLAGGPGSGKDYVLDNTLAGHGLVEINSDKALEFLMDKKGLDKTMPASEKEVRDEVRGRAKNMTELRQKLALLGRNGLIINGTGDDHEKVARIKKGLEELGYDTSMVMVNTRDEVSAQRNIERGQRGGRTVPEDIRREKWESVQNARPELAKMFGQNYMEFDNSEDLRQAPPELVKQKKDEMLELHKTIQGFVSAPPQSEAAKFWVAHELEKKDTLPVPKDGAEQTPHPGSNAAEEAKKMGLQYYGFGRYGKNGKVTHRSVHDSLVEVPKEEPTQPTLPTPGTSVTKKQKVDEEFENFFDDLISEEKKVKLVRDKNGKPRIFMLRRSAAKEAHQSGGEVMKHPKGYVIKIKEETQDVESINQSIQEQTTRSYSNFRQSGRGEQPSVGTVGTDRQTINEGFADLAAGQEYQTGSGIETSSAKTGGEGKITLAKIRSKQKEKTSVSCESIDMGIEPGLSMASSGENSTRGGLTRTKLLKKPLEELTGDETTMSIGDQKEDELKKAGINLKTFKSKKVV
jgi:hypothetical protein